MQRFSSPGLIILLLGLAWQATVSAAGIKMMVTAAFVSDKGLVVYEELAQYISKRIGGEVRVISGTSYDESNMLLEQGIIQVGFVCGMPYVQQHAQDKLQLVAMPVIASNVSRIPGTPGYASVPGKYYSYTIVHKDSPINSWQDLKGKSYIYNEMTSNSGYNMPRYKLIQLGARRWEDWFSRIDVSGSHEESIRMVAEGMADASSVDSLVLDYDRYNGDEYAKQVKVIETLFPGGTGAPPVVVSNKVSAQLRQQLQNVLTSMHRDPAGRAILNKALMQRFDPPDDRNYDDIRKMMRAAKRVGFVDHQQHIQHIVTP